MTNSLQAATQVVETGQCAEFDGVLLDLFTASTIVQVANALNPTNHARLAAMPLEKAAKVAWALATRSTNG